MQKAALKINYEKLGISLIRLVRHVLNGALLVELPGPDSERRADLLVNRL